MARELWQQGIHVAHVIIDGIIGDAEDQGLAEDANRDPEMNPDGIAASTGNLFVRSAVLGHWNSIYGLIRRSFLNS
jgi:hypothetical protein